MHPSNATPAWPRRDRLKVRPDLCRSGHMMQGGATMAFADMVASIGAFQNLPAGAAATTIESKTNFISAASEGSVIEAESEPLHAGRRSSVWQTSIRREDGKLIAVVIQTKWRSDEDRPRTRTMRSRDGYSGGAAPNTATHCRNEVS